MPHVPQLAGSLLVLAQYPVPASRLQNEAPAPQVALQDPIWQASPKPQELPQAPQLVGSIWPFAQYDVPEPPSHVVRPEAQVVVH